MAEFNIAPDLGWRPFENHLISWRIVIVILENIVFIDKGNLHREVIEDEVGLLDGEIAIPKSLLTMTVQHRFLFLRGKGNSKLAFRRIDDLLNLTFSRV